MSDIQVVDEIIDFIVETCKLDGVFSDRVFITSEVAINDLRWFSYCNHCKKQFGRKLKEKNEFFTFPYHKEMSIYYYKFNVPVYLSEYCSVSCLIVDLRDVLLKNDNYFNLL